MTRAAAGVALILGLLAGASAAAAKPEALGFVRVARGFDSPVYVTAPRTDPDRLYVVEKTGRIVVLVKGRRRATPFLDLRGQVSGDSEQGLLSLAFDPGYARNHRIYVDYTDVNGDSRIVRYTTNGVRALPSTRRELLFVDQPYPNHNGGLLAFGRDGKLYSGFGDGGSGGDPQNRAQNLSTFLGKLIRIDPNNLRAGWTIVAWGLRNPWRFSFDRATRNLYIGDVGQGSREEIDVVQTPTTGKLNFGWPVYEGDAPYKSATLTPGGRLVAPVYVYDHGGGRCSVTGGYVYRGAAVRAVRGRYFFGDYCSGDLWTLRMVGGRAAVAHLSQRLPGLSSFGESARGELYATTLDGSLWRLRG